MIQDSVRSRSEVRFCKNLVSVITHKVTFLLKGWLWPRRWSRSCSNQMFGSWLQISLGNILTPSCSRSERMRLRIQEAFSEEWLALRDEVRSSVRIELLLLYAERSQLSWFTHLTRSLLVHIASSLDYSNSPLKKNPVDPNCLIQIERAYFSSSCSSHPRLYIITLTEHFAPQLLCCDFSLIVLNH